MYKSQYIFGLLNYMIFTNANQKLINLYVVILKLMILFLLIKNGNCTQIVYSNFFEDQMINDWELTNKNTFIVVQDALCGSSHYLLFDNQATQYNVLLHKSFGLGTHNEVIIEFKLWKIDNWISNFFIIYIDNEIILDEPYSCSGSATNICGDSMQNDEVTIISKSMQHDRPSIQIIILAQNGEWGISEFFLMIEESNDFSDFISFNNQRLILQSFTSINIQEATIQEQWNYSASDLIDHCHDLYYHKSQGSLFEKQISLEDHVAITLKLKIMIFNSDATTITLKIDDTILLQIKIFSLFYFFSYIRMVIFIEMDKVQLMFSSINYGHTDINFDGFWYHYTQTNVNISNYAHTQHQIKITILTVMTSVYTPWAPWFGIRDFQLYLLLPKLNYICKDQNIYAFDGCFSFIYDCVQGCMNCVNGICINCYIGWQYIDINKSCIPICGDLILTSQEECDDGNQIPYDGCHNCRFSCPLNCDVCQFGQCLQQSSSNQQYQLSNVLLDCQANIILQNNQCINVCYDLVMDGDFKNFGCYLQGKSVMESLYQIVFIESLTIQKFHQTFEQYLIQKYTQGNLNQIYQCKQNDLEICLECEIGFTLSINHRYCIPICGDGVVQIYEICDDQNTLQLDGCYKCQQSCQLSCLNCINGECLICLDGWQLINKICQQICGDGLLAIQSYEQCDDNNQIDGDGCFQCLFECAPYCLSCIDQYHCQNCIDHFELVQNECRPICGDLYQVEGLEDCDDGNQISNDGCYNCQFQCEIDCTTCINGKCKEYIKKEEPKNNQTEPTIEQLDQICNVGCLLCLEGKCQLCEKFSTLQDGQCIKCGNGYKSEDEFCDDGNTLNNDGCSNNCNIESGWDCNIQNYQLSQCYKIAQLTLNFLNQSYDTQYISLTYTKKVKLIESNQLFFDQTMLFIESLKSDYYNFTVEPVLMNKYNYLQLKSFMNLQEILTILLQSLFLKKSNKNLN